LFTKNASRIAEQNAGEGPGLLRGLSEMPGSGKFNFHWSFWGLNAWPLSRPLGATTWLIFNCKNDIL